MMTVADLLDLFADANPGDPVTFVIQPNYPLTVDLEQVQVIDDGTVTVHFTEATGYYSATD